MVRRLAVLSIMLLVLRPVMAQLISPEQFLGYPVGSHFTPHWKIIDYFKYVAASFPEVVKLEQYGETNEGRPLMVAYVSSAINITNLEKIRSGNLALANEPSSKPTEGAPAIVWLSYNVHGNEASSTEASLLTLYSLVDPSNLKTKQWLQNTFVIIDPCLNPDGRDRYVNWYNSVSGKNYNPNLDAREHNEPWPGGRVNHYNFDLNRDWAWQTQVESRKRVALFNRWLPQIHVDFHEQGINNPYYFAPAAQPYHEVITKWQRDFQNTIGRNHARYFDEKAWLYFTKEEFDLTYPAYGDTYPLYNGAIGMTYEQAGNGSAGLGALQETGDTLTLVDRALHHFTTSLSTLEIASQNAAKLLREFHQFYVDAASGVGIYKSYVIKYNINDLGRIQSLLALLDKNGIRYGTGKATASRGYNYATGKEEAFSVVKDDIIVSSLQARSALIKVLFEPNTVLVDTLAYDITAWSLPYAYGIKTYATRDAFTVMPGVTNWPSSLMNVNSSPINDPNKSVYGYVIPWNGINTVKLVTQLLQKGIRLRYNERPFDVGGQSFERGAILVLKTSNQYYEGLRDTVIKWSNEFKIPVVPVNSGFVDKGYDFGSSKVHSIRPRRIAMLTGEGVSPEAAGEVWFYFEQEINYPVTLINATLIAEINWNNYDVLIMPDGNYKFLNDKEYADKLKSWIMGGGNLVALEGAVAQLSRLDWAIKSKKIDTTERKDIYESLKKFEGREREFITSSLPGSIFKVDLDNTHPLAFGYPGFYYTLKKDEHVYEFIKDSGWNVGVIKRDRQVAGFVGARLQNKLQDGLLFGVQELGRGHVTYLADDVLFRSFWENGKLMFANAVFLVGQ